MLPQLVRNTLQRIAKDRMLLGLTVVAVIGLLLLIATFGGGDDNKHETASKETAPAEHAAAADNSDALTPTLASQFINWWLGSAMDYNANTAQQSHTQALCWMTQDAARSFEQSLWTPQIAQAVAGGRLFAVFQPTTVAPQALNPDGSVVVGVAGTIVVQSNGQPTTQQFLASFLVRKEKEGLRVAGLDPRAGLVF
jgi:hypothetical protein